MHLYDTRWEKRAEGAPAVMAGAPSGDGWGGYAAWMTSFSSGK